MASQISVSPLPNGNGFPKTAVLRLPKASAYRSSAHLPPERGSQASCRARVSRSRITTLPMHIAPGRSVASSIPPSTGSRGPLLLESRTMSRTVQPPKRSWYSSPSRSESRSLHMERVVQLSLYDTPDILTRPRSSDPAQAPLWPQKATFGEAPVVDPQSPQRGGRPRHLLRVTNATLHQPGLRSRDPSPQHTPRFQELRSALLQKSSRLQGFAPPTSP